MSDNEQSTTNSQYTPSQLDLGLLVNDPTDDMFEQKGDTIIEVHKQDFNKQNGPSNATQPQVNYNVVDNDDLESIHGDRSVVISDRDDDDDFPKDSSDDDDYYRTRRSDDRDRRHYSDDDSSDRDCGNTNMRRKLYMKLKVYCRRKNIDFPSHIHPDSPYSELKAHLSLLQSEHHMEQSVEMCKKVMVGVTSVFEFLNTRFDPVGLKLNGWSEQINDTKDEYDEVFEELYEKHSDKVEMPPEVRLMLMIGGSAAAYHVQSSMMSTNKTPSQTVYQAPSVSNQRSSFQPNVSDPRNDDDAEIQNIIREMQNNQPSDTESVNSLRSTTSTVRRKRGSKRVNLSDL